MQVPRSYYNGCPSAIANRVKHLVMKLNVSLRPDEWRQLFQAPHLMCGKRHLDTIYTAFWFIQDQQLVNSNDYYAFIKTGSEDAWYRFDDHLVTVPSRKHVYEDNYGVPLAHTWTRTRHHHPTAYMLVYILESAIDWVLAPVADNEIPPHVGLQLIQERMEHASFAECTVCLEPSASGYSK